MVSASKPIMSDLRKLQSLFPVYGVKLESRGTPSAVNRFAYSLSRTWDPDEIQATDWFLQSIRAEYQLDWVDFAAKPMGETPAVTQKYNATHMEEQWGTGRPCYGILGSTISPWSAARSNQREDVEFWKHLKGQRKHGTRVCFS